MTSGRVTMETTFARFNIIDGESYASQHTILPNGWKKAKFVGCKIKSMAVDWFSFDRLLRTGAYLMGSCHPGYLLPSDDIK